MKKTYELNEIVLIRGEVGPNGEQWEHWPAQIGKRIGPESSPTSYKVKWLNKQKVHY
jgi:hypothetical protein